MTPQSPQLNIKKTLSKTAIILVTRQTTIQLFSLVASVILARLLTPADFGLYAIIGFFLQFLTLISDGGIGSSLIQREQGLDRHTLYTAFTVIQLFYVGASIVAIPGGFLFTHIYKGMSLSVWMIYTFILEFYLSSFRIIPAAQLERDLKYSRLAVVETLEYLSFQITAVILAMAGKGVWSFIFGALVSRVLGVILLNILSPFMPRFRFSRETASPLFKFGMALQLADIVSFIENALTPSFIAFQLGTTAVGFLNFARKVGSYPTYPLNVVNRMMFPLLSRIQDNEAEFHQTLNQIIKIYNIVLFGTTAIVLSSLSEIVGIVYGAKWIHATVLIYSVLFGALVMGYSSPITAAIMAKGRGKAFLVTNGLSALFSWGIALPSVYYWGYIGLLTLPMSGVLTFPILCFIARKYITVRIWSNFWRPAFALIGTVAIQKSIFHVIKPSGVVSLVAFLSLSGVVYFIFIFIFDKQVRNWLLNQFHKLRHRFYIRNRSSYRGEI